MLRIAPPLSLTVAEAEEGAEILAETMRDVAGKESTGTENAIKESTT